MCEERGEETSSRVGNQNYPVLPHPSKKQVRHPSNACTHFNSKILPSMPVIRQLTKPPITSCFEMKPLPSCVQSALEGSLEQWDHVQLETPCVVEAYKRLWVVILKKAAHRVVNPAEDLDDEVQ